ncbi:putative membrane protein YphA (DoxX/SURF4 family) [Methylohalomonas lacus]|uniref:Membrane protein YphA (DoxX/SURF4 family) n=1 Tax=Methylohalomonas lacus TaxID=398773 RepID=A0AAE3L3Q9_9GAMM|nr:DoxX family membrane protein [Methylohalomonas lacus]MCS3902573.1 putative membrane protein YphA (DoxX/SURF4 family) [Methylohalomonas lacus]
MPDTERLKISLLLLRLGVFIVMLMWTLDKFVNPDHAAQVFAGFYGIANAQSIMLAVGLAELALVIAFVIGLFKRWTYGLVLLLHGVSTFASFGKYLQPWDSLLFFAAWPMLAACIALYLLRDQDTLLTVKH